MTKMIPPVPTSAVMMPTPKQKIGFSIESIVGNDAAPSTNSSHHNLSLHESSQKNDSVHHHHHHQHHYQQQHHHQQQQQQQHHHQPHHHQPQTRHDIQDIINRLHHTANNLINNNHNHHNSTSNLNETYSPPPAILHMQHSRLSPEVPVLHLKRERSPAPQTPPPPPPPSTKQLSPQHSPSSSPQPQHHQHQQHHNQHPQLSPSSSLHQQQQQFNIMNTKGPIVVPSLPAGLVRPFPVGPNTPSVPPQPDIKALPPYISSPEMVPSPAQQHQHPHPHHNPHLLAAAQFQMAAAIQAGHVLGPAAAAAAAAAGLQPHSPFLQGHHGAVPRDSYPLYPWLLSRHGRIFPHRFPGNFLLQPFRKPKRIRTAFSPSQLLKLEHAFESNQYVVGAERKALAQSLNLSETQVKVWFQNRRTKHKRMQQEDEKGPNGGQSNGDRNSCDEEDDELIDMEMDDCPSDDELDASH